VVRIDPKDLCDARHQHVVRSLADLGGAAEGGDAAAAIQLELHAGMRHVVPVDRQARSRQIRRAGEADASTGRELSELVRPARGAHDAVDAVGETNRAEPQVVRGQRDGPLYDSPSELGGVYSE